MRNIYFYPPIPPKSRNLVRNPYVENFIKGLSIKENVLNKNKIANSALLDMIRFSPKMDVLFLNWIENIQSKRFAWIQFVMFLFLFLFLKLRKVKIVWVFHNIEPHEGDALMSKVIYKLLFRYSNLIITHSRKAELYLKKNTNASIQFCHHPNNPIDISKKANANISIKFDLLIWGSISRYKGILEFLKFLKESNYTSVNVKIIGLCKDLDYEKEIIQYVTSRISFENRIIPFSELNYFIKSSRYVLFPYRDRSVSSSGALFDSLSFSASCIGPKTGAFKDLENYNLCYTFEKFDDIMLILDRDKKIDLNKISSFVKENTWESFCDIIFAKLD